MITSRSGAPEKAATTDIRANEPHIGQRVVGNAEVRQIMPALKQQRLQLQHAARPVTAVALIADASLHTLPAGVHCLGSTTEQKGGK